MIFSREIYYQWKNRTDLTPHGFVTFGVNRKISFLKINLVEQAIDAD